MISNLFHYIYTVYKLRFALPLILTVSCNEYKGYVCYIKFIFLNIKLIN